MIIKAEHDYRSAINDLKDEPPITDTACFHALQCIEKSLKAFLIFNDYHIEKTHDIIHLFDVCISYDSDFEPFRVSLRGITYYAVVTRYPDDWRRSLWMKQLRLLRMQRK